MSIRFLIRNIFLYSALLIALSANSAFSQTDAKVDSITDRNFLANDSLLKLSAGCENKNDLRKALEYFKLFSKQRDSLYRLLREKDLIELKTLREFESRKTIADAEHRKEMNRDEEIRMAENKRKNLIVGFSIISLIVVGVFTLILFRRFRIEKKQKMIIEQQKALVEEKQREILSSIHYAKRIQQSLITNEKYITSALRKLRN